MAQRAPSFLAENPNPIIKQRLYNGQKLMVWEGKVKISVINGWVENPRIELAKKRLTSRIGNRQLTQDEVFDLMKNNQDVKLNDLRDDIIKNGLREPLTLSFTGKLLDGNRRFFAIKYALEGMPSSCPNRQDLEIIDAYVLMEDASEEDEQNVLVEENFSASLKIEWPDYVKALKIVEANEKGLSYTEITAKFSWGSQKIKDTLKIHEITSEFITYATAKKDLDDENGGGLGLSEQEAEGIVAKHYQFFNEAKKSFFNDLKTNLDFKIQFFKWIYEEKFSSFPEVRIAFQAWNHPEAKAALLESGPTAAKSAKAILDYNSRVIQNTDEAVGRIDTFVKFLHDMTAEQIKLIPSATRKKLAQGLETVIKMSQAVSDLTHED